MSFIQHTHSFARMPIGRTRKNKLQMDIIPTPSVTAAATATLSDEEGNTSECSHRHTSSSVYSTLESSTGGNANFYAQSDIISNQPTPSYSHPHKNQSTNAEISN